MFISCLFRKKLTDIQAVVTRIAIDLFLGNDNLGRKSIFGIRNGMIHQADTTNDLANL